MRILINGKEYEGSYMNYETERNGDAIDVSVVFTGDREETVAEFNFSIPVAEAKLDDQWKFAKQIAYKLRELDVHVLCDSFNLEMDPLGVAGMLRFDPTANQQYVSFRNTDFEELFDELLEEQQCLSDGEKLWVAWNGSNRFVPKTTRNDGDMYADGEWCFLEVTGIDEDSDRVDQVTWIENSVWDTIFEND